MPDQSIAPDAKKILVVDDNKVILKTFSLVLTARGYRVIVAETGAEAISAIRKERPDLILLDLDFPPDYGNVGTALRDGFLILDWARRMCNAEKIPVIIISHLDPADYKQKEQAAHILTHFRKPVEKDQLLAAVEKALTTGTAA